MSETIPPVEVLPLRSLISSTEQGIASRVLAQSRGGSLTLFAFDRGRTAVDRPGTVVRMPVHVPHALDAPEACRLQLITLRELGTTSVDRE